MRCKAKRPPFKKSIYVICILAAALLSVFMFGDHAVNAQSAFSCDAIVVRPLENGNLDGFLGSSLALEIINNNDAATTLMRVHLQWPTILDYPGMYTSELALNHIPHWQGIDLGDVHLTTNITDTAIDPSIPPDFFNNTPEIDRSIEPFTGATWTASFSNTTTLLVQYVALNEFSGTELYFYNPSTPSTNCRIGLNLSPPATPSVPIRNYFTTHTPTLTWSAVSWARGYQIELDDDSAFKSPLRAEVASTILAYQVVTVLPSQTYYWHVRARKSATEWSDWSKPETIIISAP